MKRLLSLFAIALAAAALVPVGAQAAFGVNSFDVEFTDENGNSANLAGSHPFAMTTTLGTNVNSEEVPEGWLRTIVLEQMAGLAGDTTAYDRCSTQEFLELVDNVNACPLKTAVGITANATSEPGLWSTAPLFNLTPPPGVLVRLGFRAVVMNVVIDVTLNPNPPYNPIAVSRNIPQLVDVFGNKTQLWGDPSDPRHDELRGSCGVYGTKLPPGDIAGFEFEGQGDSCPLEEPITRPFLTVPTNCSAPLVTRYEAISWAGERDAGSTQTHDGAGNPAPLEGCESLAFAPTIATDPTARAADSPTGLELSVDVEDKGLVTVGERAQSHIRRVALALPEGMTPNPALADGLGTCSEEDLGDETLHSDPGQGCPLDSKIGTIEVESPLIDEPVGGALYQATPHANLADDSLLAFYIVLKSSNLGIVVKQTAKVEPNPQTGQLVGITDEIPQLPFSHFRLRFREGARSPLITPRRCGTHESRATMTPWSGTAPIVATATFAVTSGPGGGPCPVDSAFDPGFSAGSQRNAAAAYSPFSMRLTRRDGDPELTRFDATLPPGVVARLAGVSMCPEGQILIARAKSGKAELRSPSCPLNSRLGRVSSSAGAGSQLAHVKGTLYFAGPFRGAPLSVVAVVPAVVGPFDVGNVVVRQALKVDRRTARVTADGSISDPIPQVLAGIRLRVKDINVDVDRSGFTLNPTNCDPLAAEATIWGEGGSLLSAADDVQASRSARFQAAGCRELGFKPRLKLRLKGGTERGDNPALRGVFRPRAGNANLASLVLRLPRSAFLDQGHIRTICTRVQFAADNCPEGAVYGRARAFTPLLSEPLEGPVYLRSSDNDLPDLVADLRGLIDVEAVARIDSVRGGIRATFTQVPDAPIDKVIVSMRGGRKGLIVNSRNLCAARNRAKARLAAHNGAIRKIRPPVRAAGCGKKRR